jgi:hypothetical protein
MCPIGILPLSSLHVVYQLVNQILNAFSANGTSTLVYYRFAGIEGKGSQTKIVLIPAATAADVRSSFGYLRRFDRQRAQGDSNASV